MKKFFSFLIAALFSASMWADNEYWFHGSSAEGWPAREMTVSADGFYEYIALTAGESFKITKGESWDGNPSYGSKFLNRGFNGTDFTGYSGGVKDIHAWDGTGDENLYVEDTSAKWYVLIYKPNTIVNTSETDPVICAATCLPDNREVTVYFVNSSNWSTVYAYGWYYQNNQVGSNNGWNQPTSEMTNTHRTYNLKEIWSYTYSQSYDMAIFDLDGDNKTGDLTLGRDKNGKMYVPGTGWVEYSFDGSLTLIPGNGGKVSFDGDTWYDAETSQNYTAATTQNIFAQANTGYTFAGWTKTEGEGTLNTGTTPNSYSVVLNSADIVEASFTENMSNLAVSKTCTAAAETACSELANPTASVDKIGYVTTATVTAATAPSGYKLSWNLTNCVRTDGGAENATEITIRSNGDGLAASAVANYDEDLSTPFIVKGGNALFGDYFESEHPLLKKTGESTVKIGYLTIPINAAAPEGDQITYNFKVIYTGAANDIWYGLHTENHASDYWYTRDAGALQLVSHETEQENIQIRADIEGDYEVKVDYTDFENLMITITFPSQGGGTAIDNTEAGNAAVKRLVNGQLVIEKNGKTFNALGAEVK